MEDALTAAMNTIERQILKTAAKGKDLQQKVDNYELVRAGMTIFGFLMGRMDTIADALEAIARDTTRDRNMYQQGFAAGMEKAHEIGMG